MKQASFFGGKAPLEQWIGYCKQPLASMIFVCLHLDDIHSYMNAASKSRSTFTTPRLCRILLSNFKSLSFFFADGRLSRNSRLSSINSLISSILFPFAVIVLGFGALFAVGTSYLVSCQSLPATYFTLDVLIFWSCLPQSQLQYRM